jgi:hypothetical protein
LYAHKNFCFLEPVPKLINCTLKARGFGTGSWKKRLEARFSPKFKVVFLKLKFWESLIILDRFGKAVNRFYTCKDG